MARGLSHLPELKEIGFTASRRLLDVQRISRDPAGGATALAALTQPVTSPAGTRTAAMPITSPRVQALLAALCVFRLLPQPAGPLPAAGRRPRLRRRHRRPHPPGQARA